MKRHIPGLSDNGNQGEKIPEGIFLVKVLRTSYRYHPQKPFYTVRFLILEPPAHAGQEFTGRLYCSERALWKMNWFLRDFQYDPELLGQDEIEDRALKGLQGVAKISRAVFNGHTFVSLDGFAPATEWQEVSTSLIPETSEQEAHNDL